MADFPHREFYVATAAVGPILALSVVIVVNAYPLLGIKVWTIRRYRGLPREKQRYVSATYTLQVCSWIGFLAAATVTFASLFCLRDSADLVSPDLELWLILLGGATLPVTAVLRQAVQSRAYEAGVPLADNALRELADLTAGRIPPTYADKEPD